MIAFPNSHVCPLAVERNNSRCSNPAGKPDAGCAACRTELVNELGKAMWEGDESFFEMLFVGHILAQEGFVGVRDEDGGIQLERVRGRIGECPGDCAIGALSPDFGGGFRLYIAIDDDSEILEVFDTLEEVTNSYFNQKPTIEKLAKNAHPS